MNYRRHVESVQNNQTNLAMIERLLEQRQLQVCIYENFVVTGLWFGQVDFRSGVLHLAAAIFGAFHFLFF